MIANVNKNKFFGSDFLSFLFFKTFYEIMSIFRKTLKILSYFIVIHNIISVAIII